MRIDKITIDWLLLPKALPSSTHYKNPRVWMGKEKWDVIRKEVYKRAKYVCEVCGGKGRRHPVEAHELWAFNLEKKEQILIRFVALCPLCHRLQHMGLAGIHDKNNLLKGSDLARHYNKLTGSKFSFDELYEMGMAIYEKISVGKYEVVLDKHDEKLLKLWDQSQE
ncbi:HNH endonuclease [Mycoplasma todarodis]|uniref:HNH endonuclease n=1 Tax=Mycoplasma todarodis TaxID=1937191 RepID=A0A4R0XLC1_9MOLU|nr:hypothetical protein [Mycoplasma todarodis]TCG11264.1 hypothetical protein C4B25_02005 [Mycoplasma todarodis]